MYCPQCGVANDDTASSCSACGFDLGKYKTQWEGGSTAPATGAEPAGPGGGDQTPSYQTPSGQQPAYQAPTGQPGPYQAPGGQQQAPPYQGQYQQRPYQSPYGAPPYQGPPYQQQYQRGYQPPPYQPGYYAARGPFGAIPRIPSYLGWAIAVLIVCFWPTGIVAVVYASQVDNKVALGDIQGAMESSRKAKTWCWVTFGIAIAWIVVVVVGAIVGGWFAGSYYWG